RHGQDWIEFTQALSEGGWGYRYVKRLSVASRGFTIARSLRNTGSRAIVTDHYGHNFTLIDDQPIGPDYRVRFPFTVALNNSINALAQAAGKEIRIRKALQPGATDNGEQIYAELAGFGAAASDDDFTIENTRTGAAVQARGDHPLSAF